MKFIISWKRNEHLKSRGSFRRIALPLFPVQRICMGAWHHSNFFDFALKFPWISLINRGSASQAFKNFCSYFFFLEIILMCLLSLAWSISFHIYYMHKVWIWGILQSDWFSTSRILAHILLVEKNKMAAKLNLRCFANEKTASCRFYSLYRIKNTIKNSHKLFTD